MAPGILAEGDVLPSKIQGQSILVESHIEISPERTTLATSSDDRVDLPSPAAFRPNCAVGAQDKEPATRACSAEMGQEKLIALLLKQQEEVLRELRDQKKVRYGMVSML